MTTVEFGVLSADLRALASKIPLKWGAIQNNRYDRLLDMFSCTTFQSLENALASHEDAVKQYFRRRWYMWQCAQCDEYLFCENGGVIHNPNPRDQSWDVDIRGINRFDIKGTVVPRDMRMDIDRLLDNPLDMIKFYYDRQSRGVRYCNQNRLFVVHHSFVAQEREFYLRCAWGVKRAAYQEFCNDLESIKLFRYAGCDAAVIFILEREKGRTEFAIPSCCG